jgi:type IV pili sensor histidine kinase/response regulator
MKTYRKYYLFLLSLIISLGITGCATTEAGKNASSEILQNSEELATQKIEPLMANSKLSALPQPNISRIQTGRYSSIRPKPTHSQRELLQVMITVSIPDEIRNVGQAISYLLKRSGYQLEQPKVLQTELSEFFSKPLPRVHRQLGPMTLEDALITLTAPAFVLQNDPVQRLIGYKLNDLYAGEAL